ncbi:MAG: DUF4252 domain-containing protein [Muribaculaceae bacterium]
MNNSILRIILITCVIFTSLTAGSQVRVFKELADMPGVESVYIGRSVMLLAGENILSNVSNQVDFDIRNVSSIEVITYDGTQSSTLQTLLSRSQQILNGLNMEVVVDQRCDGERNTIYVQPTDSTYVTFSKLVVLNYDEYDFNLVLIEGKISNTALTGDSDNDSDD